MIRLIEPGGRMYTVAGTSIANILTNWSAAGNTARWTISAGNGRFGGSSLRISSSASDSWLRIVLGNQSTIGFNAAVKIPSSMLNSTIALFSNSGSNQLIMAGSSNNQITFSNVGGSTYASSRPLIPNIWCYLECKVVFHTSTGSILLKMDGETVINETNIRTISTGSSSNFANTFDFGGGGYPISTDFDDIIIWDGQTTDAAGNTAISDFFGDVIINWLLPDGAGATTGFTPSTGSNYAQVNEATPNGDTSYVESATLNTIDSYTLANLPANITSVKSVVVAVQAKKTDIGGKQLAPLIRTGGTDYPANSNVNLPNGYLYSQRSWAINPNTGVAWTVADVNALEIGQKVMS